MQQHSPVSSDRRYGTVSKVLYECCMALSDQLTERFSKASIVIKTHTEAKSSDGYFILGGGIFFVTLLPKYEKA